MTFEICKNTSECLVGGAQNVPRIVLTTQQLFKEHSQTQGSRFKPPSSSDYLITVVPKPSLSLKKPCLLSTLITF